MLNPRENLKQKAENLIELENKINKTNRIQIEK